MSLVEGLAAAQVSPRRVRRVLRQVIEVDTGHQRRPELEDEEPDKRRRPPP